MPQFYGLIRTEGGRLHPVLGRPPSFVSPCYLEAKDKVTVSCPPSSTVNISLVTAVPLKEPEENRR